LPSILDAIGVEQVASGFMGESTLSPLTASDGENIAVYDWRLDEPMASRGMVLIVHGLGEHAARYDHVARRLNDWGFAVRSYDQYGHGESGGVRGGLPHAHRFFDDLADVVDETRLRMHSTQPLILLGHSMGGLVAAQFVLRKLRGVEALVLSSPALDAGLSTVQKLLLTTLPKIAPNLRVANGLNAAYISRDPAVVNAYRQDPLVHDRISARLAQFIAHEGAEVIAQAPTWAVPTLLMYAGADRLVNPAGSRAFTQVAPKALVHSHCFEPMYHEILNEPDSALVFERLRAWLDLRFR
jgi:alpha-beta hydrolase superfamily lysophospholipase